MPWKYTEEYYKNYTRQTWDESAEKYITFCKQLDQYGYYLLADLKPKPGEYVLDVATGPGEPAMTVANAIAPTGHVLGIDLSTKMIEIAKRTAKRRDITNVEFRVEDAEKLSMPDDTFDVALSRFGFQIITDPEAAAHEMLRVLKPGGRMGVTIWSTADKAPAIHVLVGPMLEYAEPDETGYIPTPYELGGPGEMTAILGKLGYRDARERRVSGQWHAVSVDEYIGMLLEATPLGHSLREEESSVQENVIRKTRSNIERYRKPDGSVDIPLECVVVTAAKPHA